ncbi:hypothetical protein CEK75_20070 [Salmonella enterica]|nr:hypothetical protein [Salmonella enterica]EBQ9353366.1 hypothetical protein [Salmonella enterica subsp. enterica serovar Stanley]EBF4679852.1 hypothetical protein [Salmonella enterica]EBS4364857.1 hypothetical protein [Salmonella enterica subsp. enterica serovar Stanley]EBS8484359.1 hypothetical protein [Salmonella enterica]
MKTILLSEAGRRAGLRALTVIMVIMVMLRYQERYKNAVFNKALFSIFLFKFQRVKCPLGSQHAYSLKNSHLLLS